MIKLFLFCSSQPGLPALLILLWTLQLSGCGHFANQSMDIIEHTGKTTSHKNLVVFLRGLGGSHRSFAKQGMVDAVWQQGVDFDMVAPNSHFAYYSERTLITRLRQDVILPAQHNGYERIWLVGVSMGGLGSLLYLREHPEDIDGVYLISPFLGYEEIINEINNAGGLQPWQAGEYSPEDDWQRMLWHWIQEEVIAEDTPPVYLGFGKNDTYAQAQKILATVLPEGRITQIDGAHDYATFKRLWLHFLRRDLELGY